ncbi:MAG TPA: 50S ribosomal protein L11 [Candidatus Woesebacteria bacterium]|nr:50S ribosomal protein L11 [Candidatus Woesebacteria bacterium]
MAKVVKTQLKLNLQAGEATPAPPVGPALGQHGIPIMEFIKEYNARTADKKGNVIPAVITVYEDRSFDFVIKLPPVSAMIKKTLNLKTASGKPNTEKVGKLKLTQIEAIAKEKMEDLNAHTIEAAMQIVRGTARSMGVETE